jgi:hypothetical protein
MSFCVDNKICGFILLLAVLFAAWAGAHIQGDSVSYYMMADSLAQDQDLILDNRDAARWNREKFEGVPVGVYVRFDAQGNMRYAKPVLYPLVAAPFLFFLGRFGLVFLNGLLLGFCVVFAYLALRRYSPRPDSFLIALGFFIFSFIPAYISWITPEIFLFFSCSLCSYLLLVNRPMACALIIGLVGAEKAAFLVMAVPLIVFFASRKEYKRLLKASLFCFWAALATLLINFYFIKTAFAYSHPTYMVSGGMVPHTLEELRNRLILAPSELFDMRFNSPQLLGRNTSNFFIGRFSGMIWYGFPAAVCVLIYLWRRRKLGQEEKQQNDGILAAAGLLMAVLLFFRPLNYFGGLGFFGSRYYYIFPALLLPAAFKGMKRPGLALLFFLPAALVSSQVLETSLTLRSWGISSWRAKKVLSFSVHTCKSPLKFAPLEINAVENLMVYNLVISEGLVLYAPLGIKNNPGGLLMFAKGQELVFVSHKRQGRLAIETTAGEFVLRPVLVLEDRSGIERKSFFYFRPGQGLKLIAVKEDLT